MRAAYTDGGGTAESVSATATAPVAVLEAQLGGLVYHWKNQALLAGVAVESFDFRVGNSQSTMASFTGALPTVDWTVLVNAENPTQVSVGAFLSNLQANGATGGVKLGDLALTLPAGNTSSQTSFDNINVGSVTSKAQALSLAA